MTKSEPGDSPVYRDTLAALETLRENEAEIDDLRWAYRESASVLDTFNPMTIRPNRETLDEVGYPDVEQDATRIATAPSEQWRLSEEVRSETLYRMGDRARMLGALEANPDRPDTPMQRIFEAFLQDDLPSLETLSRDELRTVLAVGRWVEGILPDDALPNSNEVAVAFARADLLAPFHHLLTDGFVDRKGQLKKLEAFLWEDTRSPPLVIYGIGGVGKSTLLAKITVDQMAKYSDRLLIVPIDLDRPSVRPHRPHTFLVEAISQVMRQLPDMAHRGESVTQHLRELGAQYAVDTAGQDYEGSRYSEKDVEWRQQEMIDAFLNFLSEPLSNPDYRALITIDTFEEAQVFGPEVAGQLVRLFARLSEIHPGVRVVFSGRVRASELGLPLDHPQSWMEEHLLPGAQSLLLKGLDQRSAVTLLAGQLGDDRRSMPRKELMEVIGVVGLNPMCIKLAGRIIRLKGVSALLNDETRGELLNDLRDAKIQAFLFGRILDHFQTERIRPLAYPGLILRRVTPDIIREVLAGPCGIELEGDAEANELYQDLSRERTIVEHDGRGGLRYRPELRRELLGDLLKKVSRETAAAIDRAAIAFYEQDDSREGRAEEIYHRLRLGEDFGTVEARWLPGLRDLLRNSLVELPDSGRIWLSQKLNITTDAATRSAADQTDWEGMAALRAERFLKSGNAKSALAALGERVARLPNSPLFQLESEALRIAGDLEAARAVCEEGLSRVSGDRRVELLLQTASIHESQGNLAEALPLVAEAAALTKGRDDPMLPFRALITHIRVLRKLGRTDERDRLCEQALELLTRDLLKDLRLYPRLFEETAAELGNENPDLLRAAVRRLGVQVRNTEQKEALADAFHQSWSEGLENVINVPKTLDLNLVKQMGQSKRAAEAIVLQSEGAGLGRFAADLLMSGASMWESASRLSDFFRASVDLGLDDKEFTKMI